MYHRRTLDEPILLAAFVLPASVLRMTHTTRVLLLLCFELQTNTYHRRVPLSLVAAAVTLRSLPDESE
jgi:hypothetical protein